MEVAAIPVVAVGLVALLLAFAAVTMYRPLIVGTLGRLPYVGYWVQQNINDLILGAVGAAAQWVDSAIGPVAAVLHQARAAVYWYHNWNGLLAGSIYATLWQIIMIRLPQLIWYATTLSNQVFAGAIAYANQVLAAAVAYANEVLQAAYAYASQVYQAALTYANEVLQAAYAYTYQVAVAVEQLVLQLYQAEQARALAAEQAVTQYALALAEQGLAYTFEGVRAAEAYARDIGILVDQDARALVDREATRAYGSELAVAAAATAAVAAVAARVTTIEDSPCQTYCSPLGDIGGLLQGLEDAGLAALLLELIAEARTHPDQVVSTLREGLQVPLQDAFQVIAR